jgi:hypothetical protein
MAFPHTIYGKPGWEKVLTSGKKHRLGTRMELPDGRVFYYALSNGTIGAGKLAMQLAVTHASHIKDLTITIAHAVGATQIAFKNTGAAIAASVLADGMVFVNDVDGEGHVYVIKMNPDTIAAAVTGFLTLEEEDGIAEALSTNSQIGLRTNKFRDAELWDASAIDGIPLGIAPTETVNDRYFWCQTWGTASVLTEGTVVLGNVVVPTASKIGGVAHGVVDGAVIAMAVLASHAATATNKVQPHIADQNVLAPIGIVEQVGATTEYSLVFLTIAR